jgi:hypothetical protein
MDDNFRMVSIRDDVSYEGNELALEMVEVADGFAVASGDCSVE